MLESVSRHFHEGMAGIILPSSQQNNSSHSSMGSGSGSRHFHEGHSRPLIGQAAHGRMAGIILLTAWHISQQNNSSHSLMKMAGN